MILRPLDPIPAASTDFLPAWSVVEQSQRQITGDCWMITQPSHAALSGEFAARMAGANLPNLDAAVIRGIALHDAGWGMPDAQAIMQSRSIGQGAPKSFVACGVGQFVDAWEKSIDVAASASATGGYIVSRHFERIAKANASKIPEDYRAISKVFFAMKRKGKPSWRQSKSTLLKNWNSSLTFYSFAICSLFMSAAARGRT